jgi:hypothetical protein
MQPFSSKIRPFFQGLERADSSKNRKKNGKYEGQTLHPILEDADVAGGINSDDVR